MTEVSSIPVNAEAQRVDPSSAVAVGRRGWSRSDPGRSIPGRSVAVAVVMAIVLVCLGCSDSDGDEAGSQTSSGNQLRVETTITEDGTVETVPTTVPVPEITAEDGVVVWVTDREPPDLHVDDPDNGTQIAAWIRQGLLEGLYGVDGNVTHIPELLAGAPVVEVNNSGTVSISYQLRDGLQWSDGTPLTANDVAYTHRIIIEGCETELDGSVVDGSDDGCIYRSANRLGYDLVTAFTVQDDTHFTVDFASFYPGWRNLYDQIFAEHAFGENADVVNANLQQWQTPDGTALPSSGPLLLTAWEQGVKLEMAANEQYHGSVNPDLTNTGAPTVSGVQVVFVPDARARAELMVSGAADLLVTNLDPDLVDLTASGAVTVAAQPGETYELLGLNLLDPHLSNPAVRQAIAYAVDKSALITEVYQPLIGEVLPAEGLGNSYWVPTQPGYQDHQTTFAGHQVDAARTALTEAGYEEGEDGVFTHPDAGRLALRAGTTGGNALREQELEVVAAQLREAGFEITIENIPGGLFFEQGPFSPEALAASESEGRDGDSDRWDLALFSWSTGPWPGAVSGAYRSGSLSNPYGFTLPEFDAASVECDALSDDTGRAECYNNLDTFATTLDHGEDGLFLIPLTQKPHYLAYGGDLTAIGVVPDTYQGGPLIAIADYQVTGAAG
jgi:peptide/nickel transport system substrate-binding protein